VAARLITEHAEPYRAAAATPYGCTIRGAYAATGIGTLHAAAPRLASKWGIPSSVTDEIVKAVLQGGKCFVRGRRLGDMGLRDISKEIGTSPFPHLDFTDVEMDWKCLVTHGRKLVPREYEYWVSAAEGEDAEAEPAPKKAGRKPTAQERVLAYIKEEYSDQIPPHVTNEDIAREVGVSEKTVRRARGRG
jgi:hypothetical protein